ncbi:phage tail protein I [Chromobacterium haemolyticum]|uniref:Phage tail protein I n=1 Tax=Chromobacterium haemolyticum TaxID=394935 RepID=A0A1W0CDK0_9NEIS|nr:phage tail protein I [Chromobacterium haemolyticum]OQS32828.1 phage tail protein I [Chromobacterium haemolyticum]
MSRHLLPNNRSELEAALADSGVLELDVERLRGVADSARCPAALLPWLAWAMSVESWSEAADEAQRRALIRQSIPIHKHKGTAGAVRRAMAALGVSVEFKEWRDYGGAPYTFRLTAWANDNHGQGQEQVLSAEMYRRLQRVVDDAKNERSHYEFRLGARFDNTLGIACAARACAVRRNAVACRPAPAHPINHPVQLASAIRARGVLRFKMEGKP